MNPLEDSLEAMVQRARGGDTEAALEVLRIAALLLPTVDSRGHPMNRRPGTVTLSNKHHPDTGKSIPVPECLRDYLASALFQIAYKDTDANKALGLAKKGRRPMQPQQHRERAAYLVHQLIEQGSSVLGAVEDVANHIARMPPPPPRLGMKVSDERNVWRGLAGTTHKAATIQKWYYEFYPATAGQRRNSRK